MWGVRKKVVLFSWKENVLTAFISHHINMRFYTLCHATRMLQVGGGSCYSQIHEWGSILLPSEHWEDSKLIICHMYEWLCTALGLVPGFIVLFCITAHDCTSQFTITPSSICSHFSTSCCSVVASNCGHSPSSEFLSVPPTAAID
jgi:hypothetical protein